MARVKIMAKGKTFTGLEVTQCQEEFALDITGDIKKNKFDSANTAMAFFSNTSLLFQYYMFYLPNRSHDIIRAGLFKLIPAAVSIQNAY